MRIGIYDPYLDDLGGGEKYMMSIASSLSNENTIDVFWDRISDRDRLLQRFHIDLSKVHFVKNIFSKHVGLFSRLFATKKYDVIIVLSDGSIPLVASKKLFLHVQQPLEKSQTHSLWGKFKMKRVDAVFCNSLYTKSFTDSVLHVDSKVIYPPVPLHAKKMKKENIILHVGRFRVANVGIADYKKQSVMVDVFKAMVDSGFTHWKFIIASGVRDQDKEEFEKLQESAKGYPISFAINKSNDELWDLYASAKIYWHASGFGENLQQHPEFAEHFGISTVEAMEAGAVPVVINAGGQKEIVTSGVNGLLWDNLEELKEKTEKVTKDAALLKKLSQQAMIRAKDFSYKKFSEHVRQLIQ